MTATMTRGRNDVQLHLFESFTNDYKPNPTRPAAKPRHQKIPANATDTSRAAAIAAANQVVGDSQRIHGYLMNRAHGGATSDSIADALEIPIQTVCPRINALARDGKIRDSGSKRPTRSGRLAIVWEAV